MTYNYTITGGVDSDLEGMAGRLVMQFKNGSSIEVNLNQVIPIPTTTVYCARWTEFGGGWAESRLSWDHLDTLVFGRPYGPSRINVSFTSYQESQGDS